MVELVQVSGIQKNYGLLTKFEVDTSTNAERHEEDDMKRELLRGFAMLTLVVALALATAAVTTNAQSANRVSADIPFEFSVGYKKMAAGEYRIQIVNTANDALLIQSADGKSSALRLSEATGRMKNNSKVRLVFHRYGERNFLAEVWTGTDTGRQLLKSQEERAIESELASIAKANGETRAPYEIVEVIASLR